MRSALLVTRVLLTALAVLSFVACGWAFLFVLLLPVRAKAKRLLVQVHILLWARAEVLGAPVGMVRNLGLAHLFTDLGHEGFVELRPERRLCCVIATV